MRWIPLIVAIVFLTCGPAAADEPHPAIREVLAMSRADVDADVMIARVRRMKQIPVLSGDEIAILKEKGVPDTVLLELVRLGSQPTDPPRARQATGTAPSARIRVVIEPSFRLHFFEVAVDGEIVATRGRILQGESEPGGVLKPPFPLRLHGAVVAYEADVEPGRHQVRGGFAVVRVDAEPEDEWSEYSRQRYVSSGVRVGESDSNGVCEVAPGETCVVTVVPVRHPRQGPAGATTYSIDYRTP